MSSETAATNPPTQPAMPSIPLVPVKSSQVFQVPSIKERGQLVRSMLVSADSMAWSFAARREGRNPNNWQEARDWAARITSRPVQHLLDLMRAADGAPHCRPA